MVGWSVGLPHHTPWLLYYSHVSLLRSPIAILDQFLTQASAVKISVYICTKHLNSGCTRRMLNVYNLDAEIWRQQTVTKPTLSFRLDCTQRMAACIRLRHHSPLRPAGKIWNPDHIEKESAAWFGWQTFKCDPFQVALQGGASDSKEFEDTMIDTGGKRPSAVQGMTPLPGQLRKMYPLFNFSRVWRAFMNNSQKIVKCQLKSVLLVAQANDWNIFVHLMTIDFTKTPIWRWPPVESVFDSKWRPPCWRWSDHLMISHLISILGRSHLDTSNHIWNETIRKISFTHEKQGWHKLRQLVDTSHVFLKIVATIWKRCSTWRKKFPTSFPDKDSANYFKYFGNSQIV